MSERKGKSVVTQFKITLYPYGIGSFLVGKKPYPQTSYFSFHILQPCSNQVVQFVK